MRPSTAKENAKMYQRGGAFPWDAFILVIMGFLFLENLSPGFSEPPREIWRELFVDLLSNQHGRRMVVIILVNRKPLMGADDVTTPLRTQQTV